MQHPDASVRTDKATVPGSSGPAPGERIVWLDIARGSSILLVVLFHASITAQFISDIHPAYWLVNDLFASVRMPLFFAISGMLSARALSRPWPVLLEKRVLLLAYLYILWSTIDFVRELASGESYSLPDWIGLIAWPNAVLWFIWALAFYFVIAKLFWGRLRYVALAFFFAVSVLISVGLLPIRSVEHSKALDYAFYFLLGAYCGQYILSLVKHWAVTFIVSSIAYLTLFLALRWEYVPQLFVSVLSILGLLAGLSGSIPLSQIPLIKGMLAYFGRHTLTIYVTHTQLLKLFVPVSAGFVSLPGFTVWGALAMGALSIWISLVLRPVFEAIGAYWLYALPRTFVEWFRSLTQSPGRPDQATNPSADSSIRRWH